MLLGNKKSQENELNWCLVLNPLQSEIDKRKIARKISEIFSLSMEESLDLVANTPIILLDNLSRPIATKIKEYFRITGAELFLTNDIFIKRKCYRTVWPEPPNLSFLDKMESTTRTTQEQQILLGPDEALKEMRSFGGKNGGSSETGAFKIPQESSSLEVARLKKEIDLWRQKYEGQMQEMQRLQKMASGAERAGVNADSLEKDVQKQKALLSKSEEKYESVKEEYREARLLFDEKITTASKEAQQWKERAEESIQRLRSIEQIKQDLERAIGQKMEEIAQWHTKHNQLSEKIQTLEASIKEEKSRSAHIQDSQRGANENQSANALFEEKLRQAGTDLENWKNRAETAEKKTESLSREKEFLNQELNRQVTEINHWREKHRELTGRFDLLKSNQGDQKQIEEKFTQKYSELEATIKTLEHSLKEAREKNVLLEKEIRDENENLQEQLKKAIRHTAEWESQAKELSANAQLLSQEKTFLEEKFDRQEKEVQGWQDKVKGLTEQLAQHEQQVRELERGRAQFEEVIGQERERFQRLQEAYHEEKSRFEEKNRHLALETETSRLHIGELSRTLESVTQQRNELEKTSAMLAQQFQELREKQKKQEQDFLEKESLFESRVASARHELADLKLRTEELNEKNRTLEKNQIRLIQELETRSQKVQEVETRSADLEKAFRELHQSHESLEKMLQVNLKHLESREKELESARRQIRELHAQIEQREAVQRRTQLANILTEKEAALKNLVREQERVEAEIREREESMRKILAEQEKVEKEIIEGKQAQRHYLEQSKKDKEKDKNLRIKLQKSDEPAAELSQSQPLDND